MRIPFERAAVPGEDARQRGLADAVRCDDCHARAGWGIWMEWALSGALFLPAVGLAAFLWA